MRVGRTAARMRWPAWLVAPGVVLHVDDQHCRTFARQPPRGRRTDTASHAGDQRNSSRQPVHRTSPRSPALCIAHNPAPRPARHQGHRSPMCSFHRRSARPRSPASPRGGTSRREESDALASQTWLWRDIRLVDPLMPHPARGTPAAALPGPAATRCATLEEPSARVAGRVLDRRDRQHRRGLAGGQRAVSCQPGARAALLLRTQCRRNPNPQRTNRFRCSYRAELAASVTENPLGPDCPDGRTPRAQVPGYPSGDHAGAVSRRRAPRAQAGRILRPDPARVIRQAGVSVVLYMGEEIDRREQMSPMPHCAPRQKFPASAPRRRSALARWGLASRRRSLVVPSDAGRGARRPVATRR